MPSVARKRNPELTRAALLRAATFEFARYGFDGARVDRIVARAGCNTRMLYHYFENKQNLYIHVLEAVYHDIRAEERKLDLVGKQPRQSLILLTVFTYRHFQAQRIFIDITRNENLARGKHIRKSKAIAEMSSPLIEQIQSIVARGIASGAFVHDVDPLQLYVSIVALSSHHLSNVHTLSAAFQTDMSDARWISERQTHVVQMVLRMVGADELEPDGQSL